jgi:thioredoxin-like negative regulator of GroEL
MTWLVLVMVVFVASFAAIAWSRRRARGRIVTVVVPVDLAPRIEVATRAFIDAAPWQAASQAEVPEAAAAIEAALIANDRKRALEVAETMLAAAPDGHATRTWLAWALLANVQPAAALDQLNHAASTASTTSGASALAIYLRARAEHLQFELAAGARDAVPPLVTTADLAVVTLASGRGAATWLKGTTDVELSAGQARAAIAEHRELTARCLAKALDALEAAPGFADAAYLVARLAVKAGLIETARALFDALATRMESRPEREAFERDRRDLADPATAVAAAKQPPLPGQAKRSRSLKVL